MRSQISQYEEQLRAAIWDEHLSVAAAIRKTGCPKAAYDWMPNLIAKYGRPKECQCGKEWQHGGPCVAVDNPACVECGGKAKRLGRHPDTGERRYQCLSPNCGRCFVKAARPFKRLKDYASKLYQLIWVQHEKVAYAATVIGVSDNTIRDWIKRLKLRYGAVPDCPCGKPGMHPGYCYMRTEQDRWSADTRRLNWVLSTPEGAQLFGSRVAIDARMGKPGKAA